MASGTNFGSRLWGFAKLILGKEFSSKYHNPLNRVSAEVTLWRSVGRASSCLQLNVSDPMIPKNDGFAPKAPVVMEIESEFLNGSNLSAKG